MDNRHIIVVPYKLDYEAPLWPPPKPHAPPRKPKEIQTISRLRALGRGVRIYCLDRHGTSHVPVPSGDGSAYQVQAAGKTMLCSYSAGSNDKWCKHLAAVTMYREAQEQLAQATSLAVTVGLHDQLEASIRDCASRRRDIEVERSQED